MPIFRYTARDKSGRKIEGTLDAPDRRAVQAELERAGAVPISVEEGRGAPAPRDKRRPGLAPRRHGQKMATRDLLIFTTELSDLLASGMTLGNALNAIARRRSGRPGDAIVTSLRDEIVRGSSLSDALAQHPRTFSTLYVSMIQAGEASGAMHEVLRQLVRHYERVQDLKEKIVGALVYPAIVLTMGVATIVFSMVYVVPKFNVIFETLGGTLPLPTRILLATSDWIVQYGWGLLIGLGIAVVMLNRSIKTRPGRLAWHRLLLRMPLIRGIVASGVYANFASTLGTLLANGVPVLRALDIVGRTVGNAVVAGELEKARERVTDGTSISGPLAAGKVMPGMMIDMLAIGEQTGDMSGALSHIARRYENELDRNVKIFTTALEPILIIVVAVLVGFVAISILMAVFNMTNGLDV